MSHWQMYLKPKYVQDDAVWVDRGQSSPSRGKCCSTWARYASGAKQAGL